MATHILQYPPTQLNSSDRQHELLSESDLLMLEERTLTEAMSLLLAARMDCVSVSGYGYGKCDRAYDYLRLQRKGLFAKLDASFGAELEAK